MYSVRMIPINNNDNYKNDNMCERQRISQTVEVET